MRKSLELDSLDRGCKLAGCIQNTGEGGVSPHHDHGGDLMWQLGTGYYGARLPNGRFDEARFLDTCEKFNVKSIKRHFLITNSWAKKNTPRQPTLRICG